MQSSDVTLAAPEAPAATTPALGTVLVTGGASGLGAAVAARVQHGGGTPVVLDRSPADPPEAGEHVVADLADARGAEEAVRGVIERHGELHAVVCAAGTDACGHLEDVAADDWDRVIAVNLVGTAAVVRAALPALGASRGRVVTIGSTLGLRALPAATAYCASKFGVVGFTRALATELAGEVGVTMVVPGGMDTHFFDGRPEEFRPAADQALAPPGEVAEAVAFALTRPPGVEIRELVVCPSTEPSWP